MLFPPIVFIWQYALERGWIIKPRSAENAQNGVLKITIQPQDYFDAKFAASYSFAIARVIRLAVYVQERVELVLRWRYARVVGLVVWAPSAVWVWTTSAPWWHADMAGLGAWFLAAVLAYTVMRRRIEYIGHASELFIIDRDVPEQEAGRLRRREINIMKNPKGDYGKLFVNEDVDAGLRRALPDAVKMVNIVTPSLARFR